MGVGWGGVGGGGGGGGWGVGGGGLGGGVGGGVPMSHVNCMSIIRIGNVAPGPATPGIEGYASSF